MKKHYFRTPEYFKQIITSEEEFSYFKANAKKGEDFVSETMQSKPWDVASEEIYNYLEQVAPNIFNKLFGVCYMDGVINAKETPIQRINYVYTKYGKYHKLTRGGELDHLIVEENFSPIFFVSNGMNMDFVEGVRVDNKEGLTYIQAEPDDFENVLLRFFRGISSTTNLDEFNTKLWDEYAHKVDGGGIIASGLVQKYEKGIYPEKIPYLEAQIDNYIRHQNNG